MPFHPDEAAAPAFEIPPGLPVPAVIPEILAPAGGREQFFAALNSGADAVYLGLKAFNARARAENFTLEELLELVPLAHRYAMRVLVTVNVVVKELELPALIDTLAALEALEVDAIIVQDLAVVRIAARYFPRLRLHASTQMAVHNLAGVRQAARYGVKRVVLARELTAAELRKIRAAVPREQLELEAFCHGSLCYSYSGLCFFSGANDARSGNRGECAYTCRKPYRILNEPGHGFLFSMMDLDTSQDLGLLVNAGVDSLKIEGRKKDAQYVATSVQLYRRRLDLLFGRPTLRLEAPAEAHAMARGGSTPEQDLKLTFQRGGTGFFLKGRYHENVIDLDNPTHLGIRAGTVARVDSRTLRFKTSVDLERFDGLRIVPGERSFHARPQHGDRVRTSTDLMQQRYENEHLQFSLREMRVDGVRVPTAAAGQWVEIELPTDLPPRSSDGPSRHGDLRPRPGDVLYKARSADLKRRIERVVVPPRDERLRPLRRIDVHVRLAESSPTLQVQVRLEKLGQRLLEDAVEVPLEPTRGQATLEQDLADTFGLFGDQGFQATSVRIEGETGWFVPRSRLKALKQRLASSLPQRYDALLEARARAAHAGVFSATGTEMTSSRTEMTSSGTEVTSARSLEAASEGRIAVDSICPPGAPLSHYGLADRRFAVKIDRLEYLSYLEAFLASHPAFPLAELIFEPKRMFLEQADQPLAAALEAFQARTALPLRLALPTVLRVWDEAPLKRYALEIAAFTDRFEVGNLGALNLLEAWGLPLERLDLASDFTLYALNSQASRFWLEQGIHSIALSIEDDLENIAEHLRRWPAGATPRYILYKDTPLFIAEACSLTALHDGCPTAKVCGYRTLEIENPEGERFYVAHEHCKSIVYAKEPFSVMHRQDALLELGVRDFRLDFLTRPYLEAAFHAVLEKALRNEAIPLTHAANFDGSLL